MQQDTSLCCIQLIFLDDVKIKAVQGAPFILTNLLTMKRQWTYGPTLLPWFDNFHTSLTCFTAL